MIYLDDNVKHGPTGCGIDIYALTENRDRATISRFLSDWVDLTAVEDRGDEELMLVALDNVGQAPRDVVYEWEPAGTLTHMIQRGLDHPRRAFRIYLPSRQPPAATICLGFTADNLLVIGLSLQEVGQSETLAQAAELLDRLATRLGCSLGLIAVEQAVPLSRREFVRIMAESASIARTYAAH